MPHKDKDKYNKYMKEYMKRRYHRRRRVLVEMLGGKCAKCDETDDLELDHIDPGGKAFPIGNMTGMPEERVLEEALKCQLLCKKHHIEKTIQDRGQHSRHDHGTLTCYRETRCRCPLCVKANSDYCKEYRRRKKKERTVTQGVNET